MVMVMPSLYTRHGDGGQTGLLYGGRIPKDDLRCEAYGTTDEVISLLGWVRASTEDQDVREFSLEIQHQLFVVGSELATAPEDYSLFLKHFAPVESSMTEQLESHIDAILLKVELPDAFIIPGASAVSALIDLARSTLRRAERRVVTLDREGLLVNKEILRYLNRLADFLFALARYQDRELPVEQLTPQVR
jgi:cob(I)alamin adenosyltransferase